MVYGTAEAGNRDEISGKMEAGRISEWKGHPGNVQISPCC